MLVTEIKNYKSLKFGYAASMLIAVTIFIAGCGGTQQQPSMEEEPVVSELDTSLVDTVAVIEAEPMVFEGFVTEFTGMPEQLTFSDADNGLGSFSPDGTRLVYQSNESGKWQIYELNLETGESSLLISSDSNDENPIWTLDGTAVLFVSDRDAIGDNEWERDIYYYNPSIDSTYRLTEVTADDWYPVAEANNSFLFLTERDAAAEMPAYNKQNALYRGYIDGTPAVEVAGTDLNPSSPLPLPDGSLLIRTSEGQLSIWSPMYNETENLLPSTMKCGTFSLHPVYDWIIFTGREEDAIDWRLYLFDMTNNTLQEISEVSGDIRYPQFSPDGNSIVYTTMSSGKFQLFRMTMLAE